MGTVVRRHRAEVADARPAVDLGVGVDHLGPLAREGQPEQVALVRDPGEVGDAHQRTAVGAPAHEGHGVACRVVRLDPLEATGLRVLRPQRGGVGVDAVQVGDEPLHARVSGVVEESPVELALLGPLVVLGELLAHEQQLLAGVGPLPGQERAHVGQLLPAVSRHLAQQRALAVHDLVVADRQHEVLGERVDHAEGQLTVVVAAVDAVAWRRTPGCRASSPCST